jgi:hypothetical protein
VLVLVEVVVVADVVVVLVEAGLDRGTIVSPAAAACGGLRSAWFRVLFLAWLVGYELEEHTTSNCCVESST